MEVPGHYLQSLGFRSKSDYMLSYPGCLEVTSNSVTKLLDKVDIVDMIKQEFTICPLVMVIDSVMLDFANRNNKQSFYWKMLKQSTDIVCAPTVKEAKSLHIGDISSNEFWFCSDWKDGDV